MTKQIAVLALILLGLAGCNTDFDTDSVALQCTGSECDTADQSSDVTSDTALDQISDDQTMDVAVDEAPDGITDVLNDTMPDDTMGDVDTMDVVVPDPCATIQCDGSETCCETMGVGSCVSVDIDSNHCGACGNACPAEQVCGMGRCRCGNPNGEICDDGSGDRCEGAACVCGPARRVCAMGESCVANRCE